jgi:hypothetical protein
MQEHFSEFIDFSFKKLRIRGPGKRCYKDIEAINVEYINLPAEFLFIPLLPQVRAQVLPKASRRNINIAVENFMNQA